MSRRNSPPLQVFAALAVCLALLPSGSLFGAPEKVLDEAIFAPEKGFGMGPAATPEEVAEALKGLPLAPAGPYEENWESIRKDYKVPGWFRDGKFGIMIHWGLFSVPAYHNEWYEKYMYGAMRDWHAQHYGPLDKFGYIRFADHFATRFNPAQWAELFRKAGATYIIPSAEHHDWYSLWDSQVSPWNSKAIGPKRDLIGELAKEARKQGLKFGVSNHSIEHYTFINPDIPNGVASDLKEPALEDFYWTTHNQERLQKFLKLWVLKNIELIDKYQVDMLWFDNGINHRNYDALKLRVAAYYYNQAAKWGKEVSLSTKAKAYLAGSILDFERQGRAPKQLTSFVWQPDDPIGPTFGYTTVNRGKADRNIDMEVTSSKLILNRLVQNVSRNGNYLLNISPRGDGSIPENQQQVLLEIGAWLHVNGEAIYGTRPWTISEEGSVHFTTKGGLQYAISLERPADNHLSLFSCGEPSGKVSQVELIGVEEPLKFTQDSEKLSITLPSRMPAQGPWVFRIKR